MRFLAEATLGRLARWLRLLGHDVEIEAGREGLLRRARAEGRTVLFRDHHVEDLLAAAGLDGIRIDPDRVADQLRLLGERYGPLPREPLTRCARCNRALEAVTPEELEGRVWPHVLRTAAALRRCPGCARVYWRGGHVDRMRAFLQRSGLPAGAFGP